MKELLIVGMLSYESPEYWILFDRCMRKNTMFPYDYFIGLDRSADKVDILRKNLPNLTLMDISIKPAKNETTHEKRIRIGNLFNKMWSSIPKNYKYIYMCDGDFALLKRGWDQILSGELDEKHPIIGYEIGPRWPAKYQGFPSVPGSFFEASKILPLSIDFCGSGKPLKIKTKEDSLIFGLPVGSELNRENGWQWPLKIRQAGYEGKIMQLLPGDHPDSKALNPKNQKEIEIYRINKKTGIKSLFEFHLKGELIGCHLTKSTCLKYNEHPISKFWIQKITEYLNETASV